MRRSSVAILMTVGVILQFSPFSAAHAGKNELTASDYVRPIDEMVGSSSEIVLIHVRAARSGACGIGGAKGVVEYEGELGRVYKGKRHARKTVKFCGYGSLAVNSTYLIMFDPPKVSRPFFSPDAVFLEFLPGRYYRMLSYESAEFTIGNKDSIVEAFYEPAITDLLRKLTAQEK